MDAAMLVRAMPGLDLARARELVDGANTALLLAGCTNVNRAAMFLAQVGHESVSLRYTTEIADGTAYEGRLDLGNTQPGDGPRFKGRSFIQITGRHNYAVLSQWAAANRLVPSPSYFVDHPAELAADRYAWTGAIWYWTVARPQLNKLADARDIEGATRAVNGGLNGLDSRRSRWQACLALGAAILPTGAHAPSDDTHSPLHVPEEDDMQPPLFIVEVDRAECARAKKSWPGIYLTDGKSYLRHICGGTTTGDNIAAYTSVGIPRAKKPITLAEFQALGGVVK
jgi:predicted chitinase